VADEQSLDVPRRSPGIFGLGPKTPPIREDSAFSPTLEQPQAQRAYPQAGTAAGGAAAGGGGVQRKKSLMQKIKTMVRQRSESIEDGGVSGQGNQRTGPSRPAVVVSGPMAGQAQYGLVGPGLSEGVVEEDEDEYGGRRVRGEETYDDAEEDVFGMSPDDRRGVDYGQTRRV
jgi:hypothetical protein